MAISSSGIESARYFGVLSELFVDKGWLQNGALSIDAVKDKETKIVTVLGTTKEVAGRLEPYPPNCRRVSRELLEQMLADVITPQPVEDPYNYTLITEDNRGRLSVAFRYPDIGQLELLSTMVPNLRQMPVPENITA